MSINYQELVPEKALGKEISQHIFQTFRAKTGLPQEIGLPLPLSCSQPVFIAPLEVK